MTDKPLWINLGCGDDIRDGFVNVDKHRGDDDPYCGANLEGKWWIAEDNTADFILARDIIEHLPDKIHTMNEAFRVLKPGGVIEITVPTTDGRGAFQDPTHVSYWNRNSFWYFEKGNVYRERFAASYGITAAFEVVNEETIMTPDGPKLTITLRKPE